MNANSRLNVQDAMRRLMNNKKLYQKALDGFQKSYHDFDTQITRTLQEGKYEDAVFQLHSMKGLSGNVGANHLYSLCHEMELLCKNAENFDKIKSKLAELSAELHLVLQEIQEGIDMG